MHVAGNKIGFSHGGVELIIKEMSSTVKHVWLVRLVAVVEGIALLELGNGSDATCLGMKALKGVEE
jgi:hypothetical protein